MEFLFLCSTQHITSEKPGGTLEGKFHAPMYYSLGNFKIEYQPSSLHQLVRE